jgi:hypothetical protein
MQRRTAPLTQAQIVRILKAAREAGVREVTMQYGEVKIAFHWLDASNEWAKGRVTERRRTML